MRSVAFEHQRGSRRRAISGITVSAAGVAALAAGLAKATPALVGLGAAVVFVGVSVLGPVLVRPVTRVVGAPLPRFRGVPGDLARQNAMRNPARTARTAAALMIGVGLVAFITIFAASLKTSVAGSFAKDYRGTHVIDSGAFDATSGMSPELAAVTRTQPGVTAVSETRIARTSINDQRVFLSAFDPTSIGRLFDLGTVTGDVAGLGDDGIAISTDTASKNGWRLGDTVAVTFATGTVDLTVRATYDRSTDWLGDEFVGIDTFNDHVPERLNARIYVATTNGDALESSAASYPSVSVVDEQGFVDSKNEEINAMLGVIYAMLALAVIIALLGIANTLALSIVERTRELGLLRALGMARAQLRAAIRWEAVLIALFGTTLGLVVGAFFGWALVRTLADEGVNHLTMPIPNLAIVTIVAVLAGVGAALLPARRAARLNVLEAIATN
jgi:putative ABC transport system permease protein